MELTITGEEKELLIRVLDQYYSNLREEIYKTEGYDFKQKLKAEEASVKDLLSRLRS